MRSEKQREASRINGAKSRGPTSPRARTSPSSDGVTHGLSEVHRILPGEDLAAFDTEVEAWFNDSTLATHTPPCSSSGPRSPRGG